MSSLVHIGEDDENDENDEDNDNRDEDNCEMVHDKKDPFVDQDWDGSVSVHSDRNNGSLTSGPGLDQVRDSESSNPDFVSQRQESSSTTTKPSNEKLLWIAFVSFQCFAVVQMTVAWIAGSEAMISDSFAMLVDAATYLLNLFAERKKRFYAQSLLLDSQSEQMSTYRSTATTTTTNPATALLLYRKYTYQLEIIPPLVTVSALVVVIGLVLRDSIHILILDTKRDKSEQADPDINLMLIFSVLNLVLDMVNVFCFAKSSHGLGYNTNVARNDGDRTSRRVSSNESNHDGMMSYSDDDNDRETIETQSDSVRRDNQDGNWDEIDKQKRSMTDCDRQRGPRNESTSNGSSTVVSTDQVIVNRQHNDRGGGEEEEGTNLNMCSAYTHVFADTLRSLAVILAASLAEFLPTVTAEVADAAAAVVVSTIILLSLIPLLRGMIQTYFALQRVNYELNQSTLHEQLDSNDDEDHDRHEEIVSLVEMQSPVYTKSEDNV